MKIWSNSEWKFEESLNRWLSKSSFSSKRFTFAWDSVNYYFLFLPPSLLSSTSKRIVSHRTIVRFLVFHLPAQSWHSRISATFSLVFFFLEKKVKTNGRATYTPRLIIVSMYEICSILGRATCRSWMAEPESAVQDRFKIDKL